MTICEGTASSRFNRSSKTFQPSLVRAMVIGLTTVSLLGRMMQPEQDWLPISIPQTYCMLASACSEDKRVVFISHLLCLDGPIPGLRPSVLPCHRDQSARSPATKANVTSYWIGNLTEVGPLGKPLVVATSLLDPFCSGGRGAVC
jgi:hypothetical protein